MNMSSMEEDQVVHDATQVFGNNGASPTMMGLYDVLRNIEEMLAPFECYIEAFEVGMAQAPPMAQGLPVAQTTHAKELKFIMPEKFDETRSKFCSFVQHVNPFLQLHPS
jgi:hypothetical protein